MKDNRRECWFESWFDTPYYHLLYQNRNFEEAELFVRNLMAFLKPHPSDQILDLACGKGRHSILLNSLGFDVTGVDLSANSISEAAKSANEHLRFRTGDMRQPQGKDEFALVLNLFTSFGYFESEEENLQTLSAIYTSLVPGGRLVLDFMNSEKAIATLPVQTRVIRGNIQFEIDKKLEFNRIVKSIRFADKGKDWSFEERVQAISQPDFERYFHEIGFEVLSLFGNYQLQPFHTLDSDRMIFIVRKPEHT